ncbi:helix-turn-helix domain-containing protein [Flavobacteriaceae bacterium]|nr:helix-turn-helix domain-containing protein [Flavobacteriaceae bacterium]
MNTSKLQVEEIRERIRTYRIEKGYSQDYMADMLNISQNTYHKLEKGYTRIHLEKFIDIAKILEIEFSELLNGPNYVYVFSGQYKKKHIKKV